MAAYKAFNGDMRDNIIRVYVPDRDNAIGYIKADYTDKEEKPIYVGYSKERSPHVVRKTPALSKGMIIAGGIIPAAIVQYFLEKSINSVLRHAGNLETLQDCQCPSQAAR